MQEQYSYVHGASEKPLIGETIGDHFDNICTRYANRQALIVRHQNVRMTYAQLKEVVDNVACGLRRLGLQAGDRVGIWSPNKLEWVLTQFATGKAGLVQVNLTTSLTTPMPKIV